MKLEKRLISFFLVLLVFMTATGRKDAKAAGYTATTLRLEKTEGTVTVKNATGRSVNLKAGSRLFNGYKIKTGTKSYAWISLDDTKVLKLDAGSQVEIQKKNKNIVVCIKSGKLFFDAKKKLSSDESLNIKTSTMVTGIRGTSGMIEVADENETRIQLYDGKVEIICFFSPTGSMQSTVLTAGQTAYALAGEKALNSLAEVVTKILKVIDIPGFVRVEIKADEELQKRIEEESSLDIAKIIETAQERLAEDEEALEKALKEIVKELENIVRENNIDTIFGDDSSENSSNAGESSEEIIPVPTPSGSPSPIPSGDPVPKPSDSPSPIPSGDPVPRPSDSPVPKPSGSPSPIPSGDPVPKPSGNPSPIPSDSTEPDYSLYSTEVSVTTTEDFKNAINNYNAGKDFAGIEIVASQMISSHQEMTINCVLIPDVLDPTAMPTLQLSDANITIEAQENRSLRINFGNIAIKHTGSLINNGSLILDGGMASNPIEESSIFQNGNYTIEGSSMGVSIENNGSLEIRDVSNIHAYKQILNQGSLVVNNIDHFFVNSISNQSTMKIENSNINLAEEACLNTTGSTFLNQVNMGRNNKNQDSPNMLIKITAGQLTIAGGNYTISGSHIIGVYSNLDGNVITKISLTEKANFSLEEPYTSSGALIYIDSSIEVPVGTDGTVMFNGNIWQENL